jgi:hypothetical protein
MPIEWGVFVPELIVGALTTLGFGFILWQLQRRSEERQFTRQLALTWAGVRAHTVRIVNGAGFMHLANSASDFGSLPRELTALCEDKPLGLWYEHLKDPDILVLSTAVDSMETARILGEKLDQTMNSGSLRLDPRPPSPEKVMMIVRSFAYGSTRSLRMTVYNVDESTMRQLERDALRLAREEGVADDVKEYRESHRVMLEHIAKLEVAFPQPGKVLARSNSRPVGAPD